MIGDDDAGKTNRRYHCWCFAVIYGYDLRRYTREANEEPTRGNPDDVNDIFSPKVSAWSTTVNSIYFIASADLIILILLLLNINIYWSFNTTLMSIDIIVIITKLKLKLIYLLLGIFWPPYYCLLRTESSCFCHTSFYHYVFRFGRICNFLAIVVRVLHFNNNNDNRGQK